MDKVPRFSTVGDLLTSLSMPLRDIARTMRSASHLSEPLLKPGADALPAPLQQLIEASLSRVDALGGKALKPGAPNLAEIATVQQALVAERPSLEHLALLVKALTFATSEALIRMGHDNVVVAETRLALLVANRLLRRAGPGERFATLADLATDILSTHAIALFDATGDAQGSMRTATLTAVLWLSLDRDTKDANQGIDLLQLSLDVTTHLAASLTSEASSDLASRLRHLAQLI